MNLTKNPARIIIAGIRGGSGKTTVTLSLIAALRNRKGTDIIPFKKGPDYIDAGWLSLAAGNPCYNLDPFLIPADAIVESFTRHATGDIAVIEGNRGIFDGVDAEGSYSTAELARLLNCPVILVIDCTKMTRTIAALVTGCMYFDERVKIEGVVLNQVSGIRHETVIRTSIENYCDIPVIGSIPRFMTGQLPERHMGLTPYQEHHDTVQVVSQLEEIGSNYLDIKKILNIARSTGPLPQDCRGISILSNQHDREQHVVPHTDTAPLLSARQQVRIGVIKDTAFQFYYPENFEELVREGAEIVEVNALTADCLPQIDALYIGGGFPETHAILLSENIRFRENMRDAADKGLPIYAECGGLMFLGEALIMKGARHPMVGIFPIVFEMHGRPQAHGYTVAEIVRENPFYPVGTVLHGHEFHYSEAKLLDGRDDWFFAMAMKRGRGIEDGLDGICCKNTFAAYTHIHALGSKQWVTGMINKAKEFAQGHGKISA